MLNLSDSQAAEVGQRGFVHVPNFLDQGEIEYLLRDFQRAVDAAPKNDYFRSVSGEVLRQVWPGCMEVAKTLQRVTGIEVDGVYDGGHYFANYRARPNPKPKAGGVLFPWHQDHENYYVSQNAFHYLNFYIPIKKPDPTKSNLTVIPFDRLQERSPRASELLLRRGATRIVRSLLGGWAIKDDDLGGKLCQLDCDPSEIEVTPHLQAGDLLLLRGDVLHRTQDAETQRVAVSFRMLNSKTNVSRKRLASGGIVKAYHMFGRPAEYREIFRFIQRTRKDTVTFGELGRYLAEQRERGLPACSRTSFASTLFWEKFRISLLGHYGKAFVKAMKPGNV